jgi:glycosyltransferase involved in cell wall biosynthesis
MRILLLCNKSPWPPKDGGACATSNIIRSLLAGNSSVTILSLNTSKHFARIEDFPDEVTKSAEYHLVDIDSKINIIRLLLNLVFSEKPYNLMRFWSPGFNMELQNILKRNFDIIQIEGLSMCIYLKTIRDYSTAKVVFRAHNIENLIWSQLAHEVGNPFKSLYFRILAQRLRRFEKNLRGKVDAVVPLSISDFNWFRDAGISEKLFLSAPGFDPAQTPNDAPSENHQVFYIGALDWLPNIYGLNWFIKYVWPIVTGSIPDAEFIIAGRNPSQKIAPHGIQNIIFKGEVESSADFMKNMSVMVVPLFSGSGIRMKILEGMSMGKCIVSTPVGAEGIICTNKRNIFIESSPSGFADAIIELVTNSSLRFMTGKKAIENVRENYNILASSEGLLNFYRELTA